jgi:hypothetical protein
MITIYHHYSWDNIAKAQKIGTKCIGDYLIFIWLRNLQKTQSLNFIWTLPRVLAGKRNRYEQSNKSKCWMVQLERKISCTSTLSTSRNSIWTLPIRFSFKIRINPEKFRLHNACLLAFLMIFFEKYKEWYHEIHKWGAYIFTLIKRVQI